MATQHSGVRFQTPDHTYDSAGVSGADQARLVAVDRVMGTAHGT